MHLARHRIAILHPVDTQRFRHQGKILLGQDEPQYQLVLLAYLLILSPAAEQEKIILLRRIVVQSVCGMNQTAMALYR